jgi:hypothetical protein
MQRSGHVPGSSTDPSAVGPLISQKDGDLSRTYAAPAVSSASSSGSAAGDLSTTSYGAAYLELRSKLTARLPTIVI